MSRRKEYLYMVVDRNYYDLPMFVGTIQEVAEFCDTKPINIKTAIHHAKKLKQKSKYEKIYIPKRERAKLMKGEY